jgi:hypothetical protein
MLAIKAIATTVLLTSALSAQWPAYPTPGVPKTADGKPNLTAPAPRGPDGKPDLSESGSINARPERQRRACASKSFPTAEIVPLAVRLSQFWNLGASFPDGLPFQPWAAELHRQRVASNSIDNPDAHCLPLGLMQLHTHGQPRKMIQTPGVIVIIYEANAGIRHIFTDGRRNRKTSRPGGSDTQPASEGDTLVVETRTCAIRLAGCRRQYHHRDRQNPRALPGVDYGHLEIQSPSAIRLTKPWTVTVHQRIMLDTDLIGSSVGKSRTRPPAMNVSGLLSRRRRGAWQTYSPHPEPV